MYEQHYGFTEKPFNLTPDPKYLYPSPGHTEALAHLDFGRRERGGFILITGEVGTGKTTLARCFLSRLPPTTATAFVIYPALSAAELLRSILEDLHVPVTGSSLKDHVDALHRFLLEARAQGREVILIIDEAQDLSPEVLEQVRLLSNLETDTEKLIQIVLMGQSELREMLARRELRQLAQRVTARAHLGPLSRADTTAYVRHRLRVAGGEGKVAFTQNALDAVHAHAQGIPRLVNSLCDRALLAGYVQGARVIDGRMVRQAAREVRGAPERSARPFLAWAGAAAVVAAGAWLLGGRLLRDGAPAAAASPLPADTPAAVSSPGPPTASRLEEAVRTLPREASYRAALERVRSLWGGEALQYTTLRTHLDQVRRLNLPAVLEMFHPSRRDTCFVALLALEGGAAEVLAGETLRVEAAEMDRYWTREAVFVWRDFDRVALDPARGPAWTRETLQRLGFLGDEADTTPAVRRFQQDAQLLSDGVVGSRTLLALYSRTTHPQPRLRGGLP